MDWKLCAQINVFLILLISLQCSCNWKLQVNKKKDAKGQIVWEEVHSKRQKREWIVPPVSIREEEDNRHRNPLAKVHSDIEVKKGIIIYKVTGQGVDQPPYNLFLMDPRTGYLNVTGVIVNREEISMLYITVRAVTSTGVDVEKPLEMRVRVMDINDNAPVFSQSVFAGAIEERSRANSLVMQILATDADEENTVNSQIAYKILSQNPSDPQMFIMNQFTGQVFTMSSYLDRESISGYSLMVGGSDLNGAAGALFGQCGADITILDVNDNFPVLEFDSYSVEIMENMVGATNLRMNVFDADEMYSDNWAAVFEIVSGNEGGWFMIDTDAHTNQGVLRIVKALDYESMKMANLAILVTNKAAFHQSVISEYHAKATSINVQVQNVKEPPVFIPNTYTIQIPSNLSRDALLQYVLTKVTAFDVENGRPATNVVYRLSENVMKWLIIDSNTGEIKMTYEMAKDYPNMDKNLTATIFAENNDDPNRTPTATIVIQPSNGNNGTSTVTGCPVITQEPRVACLTNKEVIIVGSPAANAPLRITIATGTDWTVRPLNDTAVTLVGSPSLAPNNYSVLVYVTDKNSQSCPNPFRVLIQACDCTQSGFCDALKATGKNVSLGPAAIGLMVLGFLALLLALLLLPLCVCGAGAAGAKFVPVAAGYDGAFHQWGTEGAKPEDVDMTHMLINNGPDYSDVHTSNIISGVDSGVRAAAGGGMTNTSGNGFETNTLHRQEGRFFESGIRGESNLAGSLPPPYKESGTVSMAYVESYFAEKAESFANEDENRPSNDCLLIYDNEGIGSPAGSVGCCSFIADDLDDAFLDTLGPKFKTLAEICTGSEIEPMPSGDESRLFVNVPVVETDTSFMFDDSSLNVHGNQSIPISSSTHVTGSSFSSANLQPARPVSETFIPGNVVVTETYTTSGGTMRPAVRSVEPSLPANILVTERMVESTSAPHAVFSDIPEGSNVIVTERVVRPASGVPNFIELPNMSSFSDGSNVVLRERVVAPRDVRPASGVHNFIELPNMSSFSDGSNVVLRERVVAPRDVRPASGVHNFLELPNMSSFSDGSNVVLRERVVAPRDSRLSNSFNIQDLGDAQNVVVTERVIQPMSNSQGNLTIRPEMGSSQNIYVTEKTVRSGPAVNTHLLSAEPLLTQSVGSTSPSLARSTVTKYSTVQYTKQ